MVLDLYRRIVSHGDGSEQYSTRKIKDDVITWRSDEGDLKGFLSRHTLEGGELYSGDGSVIHRAYMCRLASHLSFEIEP